MSSRAGEHTSLAHHKGEIQVAEKGSRKQSPDHDDQREEAHCDHHSATDTVTSGTQDEKWRVSEAPVMRSDYGSVDTVSQCCTVASNKRFHFPKIYNKGMKLRNVFPLYIRI